MSLPENYHLLRGPARPPRTAGLTVWVSLLLLSMNAVSFAANHLLNVRIGTHKNFDRIVFEFQSEANCEIAYKSDKLIEVVIRNAATREGFSLPALPPGLGTIRSVDAFRQGSNDLVFEINLLREAQASEKPIPGSPWKYAIDIGSKVARTEDDKPRYVPGDKPIQTRFAEAHPKTPVDFDPIKLRAVLAYFYLAIGDEPRAREEAARYESLVGEPLDLSPDFDLASANTAERKTAHTPITAQGQPLPSSLIIWYALGGGFIGGLFGVMSMRFAPRLKLLIPRGNWINSIRKLEASVTEDLEKLQKTVKSPESAAASATPPVPAAKPRPQPEAAGQVPVPVEAATESPADSRVRQVLDQHRSGRDVQAIAQNLEMSQDEVKLIIDLNQ